MHLRRRRSFADFSLLIQPQPVTKQSHGADRKACFYSIHRTTTELLPCKTVMILYQSLTVSAGLTAALYLEEAGGAKRVQGIHCICVIGSYVFRQIPALSPRCTVSIGFVHDVHNQPVLQHVMQAVCKQSCKVVKAFRTADCGMHCQAGHRTQSQMHHRHQCTSLGLQSASSAACHVGCLHMSMHVVRIQQELELQNRTPQVNNAACPTGYLHASMCIYNLV